MTSKIDNNVVDFLEHKTKFGIVSQHGQLAPLGYAEEISVLKQNKCTYVVADGSKIADTASSDLWWFLKSQREEWRTGGYTPIITSFKKAYQYNEYNGFYDDYDNYDDYENLITLDKLEKKKIEKLKEAFKSSGWEKDFFDKPNASKAKNHISDQKPTKVEDLLEELDQMIGLEGVKQHIKKLVAYHQINKIRQQKGLKNVQVSHHLAFEGDPGTGKTTVARLIAKIYHALNITQTSTLIETDRSGLVGQYIGSSAKKTQEQIKKAQGGVLFIDEAYALAQGSSSSGNKDYGQEVIATLLKAMEDQRNNLVVIFAGYHEEMKQFWNMNSGLKSRVPERNHITFDSYTDKELLEIARKISTNNHYILDQQAEKIILEQANIAQDKQHFGNGRWVRDIIESAILNQSLRLVDEKDLTEEILNKLTFEDIPMLEKDKNTIFGF